MDNRTECIGCAFAHQHPAPGGTMGFTVPPPPPPPARPAGAGTAVLVAKDEHYRFPLKPIGSDARDWKRCFSRPPMNDDAITAGGDAVPDACWFNDQIPEREFRIRSGTPDEWRGRIGGYIVPVIARPLVIAQRPLIHLGQELRPIQLAVFLGQASRPFKQPWRLSRRRPPPMRERRPTRAA